MFLQYYGLREQPFGVTPDPRFLYFSATHREALASLFYGIESGCGFLSLIAPPGMGKTTLLFHLLDKLRGSAQTVFLFQTQCGSREFFRYLLTDLGVDATEQNMARMHESLNAVLLRNAHIGRRVVVVIDEAQNLDDSVLETVRLLSDFETPDAKLMQIILSGQPQLADKLSNPALTQLRQRISIVSRLHPFTRVETMVHIEFRLCTAGYSGPPLFTYEATELIAAHSGGIPRIINNICFNAMTLGFAKRQKQIDATIVSEVLADLDLEGLGSHPLAPGLVSGNSLTTFDGITPTDEQSYQEFHTAVRSAWGKDTETKSGDETAGSDVLGIRLGKANQSPKSIFQTPAGVQALSGSPFTLDGQPARPFADPIAAESSPIQSGKRSDEAPLRVNRGGESRNSFAAVATASARAHASSSSEEGNPIEEGGQIAVEVSSDHSRNGHKKATPSAGRNSRQKTTELHLSSPIEEEQPVSNGQSIWGRAFSRLWQNSKKNSAEAKEKKRASGGSSIIVAALVLGAGGYLMWNRSNEALKPTVDNVPAISTSDVTNLPASSPERELAKSSENQTKQNSVLSNTSRGDVPSIITLESGQTLSEVSVRYLGRFNNELTQQIQNLNPEIKNPNVVFAGAQVRLPTQPGAIDRTVPNVESDQSPEEHSR